MSRIQSGNLFLNKEPIDLNSLVTEVTKEIADENPQHEIRRDGQISGKIIADESQIVQVLRNLISNAIKYAPDSNQVNIYLSEVSNYAKISIQDYGLGIAVEDQKRIFDRFFRSTDIQHNYPGMGIGLYVSQQIVEEHGGQLWVDSELGKGSIFSLTLPITP